MIDSPPQVFHQLPYGTIWPTSLGVGLGSTFKVWLPLSPWPHEGPLPSLSRLDMATLRRVITIPCGPARKQRWAVERERAEVFGTLRRWVLAVRDQADRGQKVLTIRLPPHESAGEVLMCLCQPWFRLVAGAPPAKRTCYRILHEWIG